MLDERAADFGSTWIARYIAVEFAGIYNGMGAHVNLFYRKPYPLA